MKGLKREVILQAQEQGVHTQHKITVPFDIAGLAGWEKGDLLEIVFIFGSGKVSIEKVN